jgi:hypothetical protein
VLAGAITLDEAYRTRRASSDVLPRMAKGRLGLERGDGAALD